MVLAEFVKFKHGLYKSCGIECLECIMLEPCLLQPCFHVAGRVPRRARLSNFELLKTGLLIEQFERNRTFENGLSYNM